MTTAVSPAESIRRVVNTEVERPSANGAGAGAGGSTPVAPFTAGAAPSGAVVSSTALLDRVEEMMGQLEERILEELERRGGRFAGLF